MTGKTDTRFRKGQSGNPKGRPRKRSSQGNVFADILDQTHVIKQNGVERELTLEEALQLQTVQAALAGECKARNIVFKWIVEREVWRASKRSNSARENEPEVILVRERDSDNAFEAMCLLGIADAREAHCDPDDASLVDYSRVQLQPWTIIAAFERMPALTQDTDLMARLRMQGLHPDQLEQQ